MISLKEQQTQDTMNPLASDIFIDKAHAAG